MIALIQRVSNAKVVVDNEVIGAIDTGLLALIGVEKGDASASVARIANRILGYRVFPDAQGKMNLSLQDIQGGLLLVPQFTLAADTGKGMRPGFSAAADPALGATLFDDLLALARQKHPNVQQGRFGADMAVTLTNDGPVTFWLE